MMTMTPAFNGVVDVVLIDISNKIDFSCSLNLLVHFYFFDAPEKLFLRVTHSLQIFLLLSAIFCLGIVLLGMLLQVVFYTKNMTIFIKIPAHN